MEEIQIRKYGEKDIPAMVKIWNEVVEDGIAFPQLEVLTEESGREFFISAEPVFLKLLFIAYG